MTPATCRAVLRAFLEKHIRIDEWGVNMPAKIIRLDHPPSIAREEPASSDITTSGTFAGEGEAPLLGDMRLAYTILFRFAEEYTYHELPRADAEAIALKIVTILRTNPECVDEEFHNIEATASVIAVESEDKDWLLVYKFTIRPFFEIEREDFESLSPLMSR